MGVRLFKIAANDEVIYTGTGPCFGFSASHRDLEFHDCSHIAYSLHHDTLMDQQVLGGILGVPQYDSSEAVLRVARDVCSLPHYAGLEVVQINHGREFRNHWVLKAPVSMPADQIITAFFMCRNIVTSGQSLDTYQWIINKGYPCQVAMIMTQLASRKGTIAEWESESSRWGRSHQRESAMIDVRNFGADSFERFVLGNPIPWYQGTFVANSGYTRDSSFSNNERISTTISQSNLDSSINPIQEQRLMCSVMGIDNDSPIMLPENFDDDTLQFFLEEALPEGMSQGLAQVEPTRPLIYGIAPVGTVVRLTDTGRYRYPGDLDNNPHTLEGTIIENFSGELFAYRVQWSNGVVNFYTREELETNNM